MPNSSNNPADPGAIAQYFEDVETSTSTSTPLNAAMAKPNSIILPAAPSESTTATEADTRMMPLQASSLVAPTETIFLINEVGEPDLLFGSNEAEFIAGRFGDSTLFGNGGEDTLVGDLEGEGNDKLFAGKGNDEVLGNGGDDILFGEEGDDFLFGGAGNDYLRGGEGDDSLFGGAGTDIFAIFPGSGKDIIFDFEAPIDIIGLGGGLSFGQLTIDQQGTGTVISANGEELVVVLNTTATNFTEATFLSV